MTISPITVVGNVASSLKAGTTKQGDPYVFFALAENRRRFDKSTQRWVDTHTNWFNVSAFGALAQNALQSIDKGDQVIVMGDITVRDYPKKDETKGQSTDIRAIGLGPNLLWATTTVQRARRLEASAPASDVDGFSQHELAGDTGSNRGEQLATVGAEQTSGWADAAPIDVDPPF